MSNERPRLAEVAELLARLEAQRWSLSDGLAAASLRSPSTSDPRPLLTVLDALRDATIDARLVGRRGGEQLIMHYYEGVASLLRLPESSPRSMFDDRAEQEAAERLWAGDPDAAFVLPWEWSAEAEVALARLVGPLEHGVDARVTISQRTIQEVVSSAAFWELGEFLPPPGTRRVLLALDAPATSVDLGVLTLAGPASSLTNLPAAGDWRSSPEVHGEAPNLPAPPALLQLGAESSIEATWAAIVAHLRQCAGAAAWCELASDVRVRDGGVQLTFRGFRRVSLTLSTFRPIQKQCCRSTTGRARRKAQTGCWPCSKWQAC
jgi:hypothetical protein